MIAAASPLVGEIGIDNREVGDAELPIDRHLPGLSKQFDGPGPIVRGVAFQKYDAAREPTVADGHVVGGILHHAQRLLGVPPGRIVGGHKSHRDGCGVSISDDERVGQRVSVTGDLKGGVGVVSPPGYVEDGPRESP